MFNFLSKYLEQFYRPEERAALEVQIQDFSGEKKIENCKVLDATPVFRNTLNKYLPLFKANIDLTVGYGGNVPFDAEIITFLKKSGIKTVENGKSSESFDFILDCAGANADIEVKYGVSELTRSGFYHYQQKNKKVFLADSGKIKTIETALGTGEGFFRAMKKLGLAEMKNKNILLLGCGKVGFGVAMYCLDAGANVYAVDDWQNRPVPPMIHAVSRFDRNKINSLLDDAYCVITATGIYGSLTETLDLQKLVNSNALIANIGVEDEFGGLIAPSRILNANRPLNFILDEPTHLKFIDPTMALHNAGMLELLKNTDGENFIIPSEKLNDYYLNIVRKHGIINSDLEKLEKYSCKR